MIATRRSRNILVIMAVVAGIATIDAARGDELDLLALLAAVDALTLVLLLRAFGPRRELRVRADLGRWLEERAALTGEPAERIADRALSESRRTYEAPHPGGGDG